MDRQIVYPGAIPLETDLLNTNKFAMIGLAKLASAVLGSDTCLAGLKCTPTLPASLNVVISAGEIYCLQHIDQTAYSTLTSDHSDTILKQGLTKDLILELRAPAQAGMSISYLIQVGYEDVDVGDSVLPYYNAADPSMTFSGPANNGKAQPDVRAGKCVVSLKASSAASAGMQMTPLPDIGFVSAWVIDVSSDMKMIESCDIHVAPGAPFIPSCGIYAAIQQAKPTFANDSGSANAYQAFYQPPLPPLVDGMRLAFKAREVNSGKSTFSVRPGEVH
ncbi:MULTISPECIES: hypothetical protein [unclassified Pantoea]|uniref:hypothetical protein n=1 Tax=unclassified Pantoea TaxID=2630326 RepID=UPI001CD792EB|nr:MULTISPECIES: hypothetical protein [unclassified Pantoea]MCA1179773.1 hypothetical protein [Pantoea sp. alder69]MCA1253625.1 hypothetical protein [Pantoea sp. alder70]MCA1268259.1 hypothetical protein [Pantoea sp. alder81]